MRHRLLMFVVALGSALALTACGSSGGGAAQTSGVNTVHPSPLESTGVAAPSAAVTVNKSIVDPAFGNKTTVLKYVGGYRPSEAALRKDSSLADDSVVLVKLRVMVGKKYFGTLGPEVFRLAGRGSAADTPVTTSLNDELTKAGYAPLKATTPGKASTGWVTFTPPAGMANYVLLYTRAASGTSGGTAVKAKTFDLPLN